jgi:hypothetical protein
VANRSLQLGFRYFFIDSCSGNLTRAECLPHPLFEYYFRRCGVGWVKDIDLGMRWPDLHRSGRKSTQPNKPEKLVP